MRTEGTGSSQAPSLGPPHIRGEVTVTIINYVITQEEPFLLSRQESPGLCGKSGFCYFKVSSASGHVGSKLPPPNCANTRKLRPLFLISMGENKIWSESI